MVHTALCMDMHRSTLVYIYIYIYIADIQVIAKKFSDIRSWQA